MLFTIPYNNSDPDEFINTFLPYREQIYSFYFGLPMVFATHNPQKASITKTLSEYGNVIRFLNLIKGKFKAVICLNTPIYPLDYEQAKLLFFRELGFLVEELNLAAVNVASPSLAKLIHELFPSLEIQTSCNTFAFLSNMYNLWNEEFGTTVFNLPRESLRTPWLLEDFKKTGFTSKCIVNEGCIYGCPGGIEHACSHSLEGHPYCYRNFCDRDSYRLSDIFKSNFIPPHRLNDFEGKLDIAKIAGRYFSTEDIFKTFLAYLNQDPEADIDTILHTRCKRYLRENKIHLKAKDWPKKTLTCECKECKTCNICYKAMEHAIKRQGLGVNTLTRDI